MPIPEYLSMWRFRLFWKLVLSYSGLNLAAVLAMVLAASTSDASRVPQRLWLVGIVAAGSIVLMTVWLVRRIVEPLATLSDAATALAADGEPPPLEFGRHDELGELAESFEEMRRTVRARLSAAEESAQRLSTVLGGMDEGVIAIGANRSVILANTAARRMLDLPGRDVPGAPLADILPEVELRRLALNVLRESISRKMTLERNGPAQRVLGIQATPMPGQPCPGVVLVLHDETELRRLESLRQEFVANVSHELKTPLSSIKAYAETLSSGAIHDPQINLRFVARIEEQADRLHQLILDLLRLARIESGEQTFDIAAVPIAQVVQACVADHQNAADAKSIELFAEQTDLKVRVRADEEGLRQILDNLVDNAIKYTPAGGKVTLRSCCDGRMIRLEVQDTGIGIPREFQPRVFERFFRVDKARSRELGGTGLGLSIVKHLAQSFGGSVSVQSQPGKGSMFAVELPAA